jgi:hypothetical protein
MTDKFTQQFIDQELEKLKKATSRPWEYTDLWPDGTRSIIETSEAATHTNAMLGIGKVKYFVFADLDCIISAVNNWEDALKEIMKLQEVLTEIRDLARTGLPPENMTEDHWKQRKLNRISYEASKALEGEKGC